MKIISLELVLLYPSISVLLPGESSLPSIDPTHVMGLYPDLLPTDYRKQLQYPNPLPVLSGAELEKAHLALIDYLTQVSIIRRCMGEFTWEFQDLLPFGRELRAFCNACGITESSAVEVKSEWHISFCCFSLLSHTTELGFFLFVVFFVSPNHDTKKHTRFLQIHN